MPPRVKVIEALLGPGRKDWRQFFIKGARIDEVHSVYTCLLCAGKKDHADSCSWIWNSSAAAERRLHVLTHSVEEVRTFLAAGARTHPVISVESREERRARTLFAFLVRQKVSLHAVESPEFKALVRELEVRLPPSHEDASNILQTCAYKISKSDFPDQMTLLLASLVVDSWADRFGTRYYSVSIHTKTNTNQYGQYSTNGMQDEQWLSRLLSQIIIELGDRNYRLVALTADDTPTIAAAWNSLGGKYMNMIRQTCICQSVNLCLEKALNNIGALAKMKEAREYLESKGRIIYTSYTPTCWCWANDVFQELIEAGNRMKDDPRMNSYMDTFEDAEKITKVVCDFVDIVERKDASFILTTMALHALDKATDVPPFLGLHNAIQKMWKNKLARTGLFKAVVLMAPCFFQDTVVYERWEIGDIQSRVAEIERVASFFDLEIHESLISQMLTHTGIFSHAFVRRFDVVSEANSGGISASADQKQSDNMVLDAAALHKCLALQQASIQWWEKVSPRLRGFSREIPRGLHLNVAMHQSYMNLTKLWEILMAIRPAKVAVERISDADDKILAPEEFHLSPALLDPIVLLAAEEDSQ